VEEELKAAFADMSVQLIPGHGGVFEVKLDKKLIYTRSEKGRFPEDGEISSLIKDSA
jgi:selenoprotein W-related protein